MKPIRNERNRRLVHDPWQFDQTDTEHSDVDHFVDDDGGLESECVERQFACGCGCLRQAGGFCAICLQTVCVSCFGFCRHCHKPLCPRHSMFATESSGQEFRLCQLCYESMGRKRLLLQVSRLLLSPFIKLEGSNER